MSSSHAPACLEAGQPQERCKRYNEEKGKAGLVLSMFDDASHVAAYPPSVL